MISITPEFITEAEEKSLIAFCNDSFDNEERRVKKGTNGNRSRILRYGYDYTTDKWLCSPTSRLFKLSASIGQLNSITINEYKPGDKIEPHIDSLEFDDLIAILSLGADCRMQLDCVWKDQTKNFFLPRRSLFKMTGEERYKWKHSIPPLEGKETRISIVFRKRIV